MGTNRLRRCARAGIWRWCRFFDQQFVGATGGACALFVAPGIVGTGAMGCERMVGARHRARAIHGLVRTHFQFERSVRADAIGRLAVIGLDYGGVIATALRRHRCVVDAMHYLGRIVGARFTAQRAWRELALARWAWVVVVVATTWLAYRIPAGSFEPLWLAWHALGAAFAPLLIVQLSGKRVRAGSALGSIWAGFALTLIFHAMPDTTGDLLERAIPFIAAMGIALSGGDQRRNPNRADRGDETVHDRLPI